MISIHCPLTDATRHLIDARRLHLMKPTAYLVNTSRGPIVDEKALVEALQKNKIAGAGLDAHVVEPLPMDHPFRKLANTVVTPHLGYVTEDVYRIFFRDTAENIRAFIDGKPVRMVPRPK